MKRGRFVLNLAKKIVFELKPLCKKIEIAGSIRRKSEDPRDIDIVLIPKDRIKLEEKMKTLGRFVQGGEKKSRWKIKNVQTELYYTTEEEWGATLLAYSSKKGAGIGLRIVARMKGFKLTQHGLFNIKTGKKIAGKTEREIYSAMGREYKDPWER